MATMWDPLQTAVIVASLVVAAGSLLYVVPDRRPDRWLVLAVGVVQVMLLVQLLVGVVQVVEGVPDGVSVATFLGYLVGLAVALPVGVWWAKGEPSRAGTGVLLVVLVVVPVLVVRLQQIWDPALA